MYVLHSMWHHILCIYIQTEYAFMGENTECKKMGEMGCLTSILELIL